jgi:hypothetical protein
MRRLFRNPGPLVYGTLLVGAVLDAESFKGETFAATIGGVVITMVLIWLAHSYAQITGDRVRKREHLTVGMVARRLEHELPMLTGAAVPLVVVVICWLAGASLSTALTAGVVAAAITLVVVEVIAGIAAQLSAGEFVLQGSVGVLLGLGILGLKLVYH